MCLYCVQKKMEVERMSENLKNEFFMLAENMRHGLQAVYELTDRLEMLKKANVEEIRCTTAMRDNIDIMLKQMDEISDIYGRISGYERRESRITVASSFVMKGTRALITDDNEVNNNIVSQMLKQFNIEVDTAKNGEEAVELFKQKEYDMVLMDYLMPPGIDGVETVRRIRNLGHRGENQLIIGLTANIAEEFKKGLNKYNVELILFKPVKYNQIAVILQNELPDKIIPV